MHPIKDKITAIVLAAGQGIRFGGDKLLHDVMVKGPHNNTSKKAMGLISALNVRPHVDEVICVVRPDDTALIALFKQHNLKVVTNPDYLLGMSSSIKIGIKNAKPNHNIMACLGDMPFIKDTSYQSIITAFLKQSPLACRPTFISNKNKAQPGHPVIFSHEMKSLLLELNGDQGAQSVMTSLSVYKIALDDIGVVKDIDQVTDLPDDLASQ